MLLEASTPPPPSGKHSAPVLRIHVTDEGLWRPQKKFVGSLKISQALLLSTFSYFLLLFLSIPLFLSFFSKPHLLYNNKLSQWVSPTSFLTPVSLVSSLLVLLSLFRLNRIANDAPQWPTPSCRTGATSSGK